MTAVNPSNLWKKRLGDWVLNPYVGCEHGCFHCYCPVMPGVRFMNGGRPQREWGRYLIPKAGLVEALRDQLRAFTPDKARRTAWGDGWVLMSFLTDCYTPSEARHRLTRECLKLLLEAGHKVRVQTRSALVERDFDILSSFPGRVLLGTSLGHLDDALARVLEPRATAPTRRLRMLAKAAERGIAVYGAVAPFLPFHGEEVFQKALGKLLPLGPREVFCEVLNPKGDNIAMMVGALRPEYPEFAASLRGYGPPAWAWFTVRTLRMGLRRTRRFIPWPDTRCLWRSHLPERENRFLERFLPGPASALADAV